jgi:hypothetical protein
MSSLFDTLEDECDRLLKQEGKVPQAIFLGKKQTEMFINELMDMQETPESDRKEMREFFLKCETIINDDVNVIFTDKEDEMRFVTKKELLN